MSTALHAPQAQSSTPTVSPMEIRGWWGVASILFYPLLVFQLLLPFWPALFESLAAALHVEAFQLYLDVSVVSRVALLLIAATGVARAIVAAFGIHSRHQRVKEYFQTTRLPSTVLKDRLTALQAYDLPFVVYGDPVPRAFVLGIFRTRIYISTGLLDALSDIELGSVIMHEVHHHRHRDPLKGFLLSILSHLFYYIPVIRSYAEFWQQQREWEADAAAKRVSNAESIAQALLKLLTINPQLQSAGGFVLGARQAAAASPALHGMGNVSERIKLLLNLQAMRPWRMRAREYAHSVLSLTFIAVLCLGLIAPVQLEVFANTPQTPATNVDAAGWVLPDRVDEFWVPAFQSPVRRIRHVGVDRATAPPEGRHRLLP